MDDLINSAHKIISQASEIKRAYACDLLEKRNVVGVGLGYKISHGVSTGEVGVIVSVSRKVDPSILSSADMVPQELDGIKTDVVETGTLRAFQINPRDRWRPVVPPGASVGHKDITAGTFGCLVQREGEVFILSNNHVLADANDGREGDSILQPGPADGGTTGDRIATLVDYIPLDFGETSSECSLADFAVKSLNALADMVGSSHRLQAVRRTPGVNHVDAALARPLLPSSVTHEILQIGFPQGTAGVTLGTRVQKTGRTTGHTQGTITQLDATVRIDYDGRSALFSGQMIASPMSQPGDSGSAVLDMDNHVVGLLFAGSEAATIINPIDDVLTALDIELVL